MICVLGFDAASVRVLDRMLVAGDLPVLASLIERGARTELSSPALDFAAGAFHTLYSGVEISEHGLFYPFQFDPAAQRVRYATAFDAPDAVWERLARSGLRSLVLDPYESRPPREWEGDLACGVSFRDRVVLPRWVLPRGASKLAPRGPQATEIFGQPRTGDLMRLREKLLAGPERLARAARAFLARDRYDLAWITFPSAHLAGHQFWDLSQLGGEPPPRDRELFGRTIEDVYRAVDTAMGAIVEALPEGSDVIVTSAVGMDVNTSRADLLPGMLARVLAGGPLPDDSAGAIWRLRAGLPAPVRRAVASALPTRLALELTSRLELQGVDFRSAPIFVHPADNQGYLRLNLRGRERDGILMPEGAEALIAEVEEGLCTFRDPDGHDAVESVARTAAIYPGERSDRLPDLVVRWSDRPATMLRYVDSDRFGRIERAGAGSGRSGNHTPGDAWAVVAQGASGGLRIPEHPRLADVAATVAAVSGADSNGLSGSSLIG